MRSLLLAVVLLSGSAVAQSVRYVDADATGAADGSSWADAFPDLQQVLVTVEAGDEVWVAEGIYRPTDGADRDASFVLTSGVGLYGGFDGTEDARDERDPEQNVTVLSGDLGVPDDVSDNAYHVIVASGVDGSTVLDGFTVTGGNGDGVNPRNRGGGIYAENSSLVVRDCRIVENRVVQTDGNGGGGGAFFGTSGAPRFEGVVFEHNEGVGAIGGGLWLLDADGVGGSGAGASEEALVEALVREARGAGAPDGTRPSGGGVDLHAALYDAVFAENAARFGGGIRATNAGLVLVRAAFVRNTASLAAGGLWISGATGQSVEGHLVDVTFYGNSVQASNSLSGGMNGSGATFALTNVAFVGNTARSAGGLGLGGGGTSVLANVTFTANEATGEGGGLRLANGFDLTVRNGVFWGNAIDEIDATSGLATLSHVLIAGGCPPDPPLGETECEALLDVDPLFARTPDPGPDGAWGTPDDDYGDLRLQEGSPAVDFGEVDFLPADTFDLDGDGDTTEPLPLDLAGDPRVIGDEVDLGAYEHPGPVAVEPEPTASALALDAYPNPARGPVTVSLGLSRAQRVGVIVYDVRGRRVTVLHEGPLPAGRHALPFDTALLPSGVYFLRLRAEAASLTRRLVVLR